MENSELIKQFVKGDEKSFDILVKNNRLWVMGLIESIVHNKYDSEDITQDVFVSIYFSLHKFKFQSTFKTWMYRVIINRINNYFRKEKLRSIFNHDIENKDNVVTNNIDNENLELYKMTYKLPKIQRNVVILRVFQDLQFKAISDILKISVNSAKVSFHKAKGNLKRMVNG